MQKRKPWDDYFCDIAERVAERSTCTRLSVGAVVVRDKRMLSTGYNGSAPNQPHCTDVGCDTRDDGKCIRTIHAEDNALTWCAQNGIDTMGATIYVTHFPCRHCARQIADHFISEVVYIHDYNNSQEAVEVFFQYGITVRKWEGGIERETKVM